MCYSDVVCDSQLEVMKVSFRDRYKRVGETTIIDDAKSYVVVAYFKDGDGDAFVKHSGSYDECADYAERNESDDNIESYYVAEVVA